MAFLVVVGAIVIALRARSSADRAERAAERADLAAERSRAVALAARAQAVRERDPMLSLLLAREAVRVEPVAPALTELYASLAASRWRATRGAPDRPVSAARWDRSGDPAAATPTVLLLEGGDWNAWRPLDEPTSLAAATGPARAGAGASGVGASPASQSWISSDGHSAVLFAGGELSSTASGAGPLPPPGSARMPRPTCADANGTGPDCVVLAGLDDGALLVWRGARSEPVTIAAHRSGVHACRISPGADLVASAGIDGAVGIWHTDGTPVARLVDEGAGAVLDIAWSPDGATLASVAVDGSLRLCSAGGGAVRLLARYPEVPTRVTFAPDGTRVLVLSAEGAARLLEVGDGSGYVLPGHDGAVLDGAFSPDGRRIATASEDGAVRLWDDRGVLLLELPAGPDAVRHVEFSPDGRLLLTVSKDGVAAVWATESAAGVVCAVARTGLADVRFAPDGRHLVTVSEAGMARIHGLDGEVLATHAQVRCAAWRQDSRSLDLGGERGELIEFRPRVLRGPGDTASDETPDPGAAWSARPGSGRVTSIARAPGADEAALALTTEDGRLRWREGDSGEVHELKYEGPLTGAVWLRGDILTFGPGADGVLVRTDPSAGLPPTDANSTAALAAARSGDARPAMGDEESDDEARTDPSAGPIATAVAAAVGADGTLLAVDANGHATPWPGAPPAARLLAWSPGGERLAVAFDAGRLGVCDTDTGVWRLRDAHASWISALVHTRDGERLLTASADRTVRVWTHDLAPVALVAENTGWIRDMDVAPDGSRVATAAADGTLRIFPLDPGELTALADRRVSRELTPAELSAAVGDPLPDERRERR